LKDAMAMAVESCRPAIESARHELQLSVPAEPLNVSGDRIRLLQVFSNVLNNATKYTPPEGLICVRMWREGAQAVISIRDNGIGIPPSRLDQVFDLFAQLDHSYDRTGGGLGIGLTLARRLVEMHGGRIEARSEGADRGSEFIIRLPTVDVASPEVGAERQNLSRRAGRRVLIADDNQD